MGQEVLAKQSPQDFLHSLDSLFKQVESWAAEAGLMVARSQLSINEEAYGAYEASVLTISSPQGKLLATFKPIGANIIGANARVDLMGNFDLLTIVQLDEGGPRISTIISVADASREVSTRPLYKGVTDAGWYWIESKKLARAYKLDKTLFFELLSLVSGHVFA